MSKQDIKLSLSGQLAAISHLFYLSKQNKIFILKLSTQQECTTTVNIICSLSSSLLPSTRDICKTLLMCPPLSQIIYISHLKPVTLHKNTRSEIKAYQLTKHSTIQHSSSSTPCTLPSPPSNLVSYRGIVTSANPASGYYTLDKTVFLATSLLCVVTNVPCISLANTVTVHNAHIAKFRGKKWLVMCGASFIQIHDEELNVHPSQKELDRNMRNPVINIVQELGGNWTSQEILQLLENFKILKYNYPDNIILEKLLSITLENENRKSNSSRSLSKEFLDHQSCCSLIVGTGYKCRVRTLVGLDQLGEIIDNNCNLGETENNDTKPEEREIEFDGSGDVPVIIGKVDIDKKNGKIVLKDNKTSILMVGNFENVDLGHFLLIQRFTVGSELSSLSYIFVHKFRNMGSLDKIPPTVNTKSSKVTDVKNCQVIGKSEVITDRRGQYFLIFCHTEEEGKIILKICNLSKYNLIKQNLKVEFSSTSSSCFSVTESINSNDFVIKKLFGEVPWFELRPDVSIKISEVDLVNVAFVYTLATAEDVPCEELVNIAGVVVSNSIDDSSCMSLPSVDHDRGVKVKLQLTLAEQVDQETTHYTFYLAVLYPLGLIPGTLVQVTSVIKTRSKKGRTYFYSTPFTTINYVHASNNSDSSNHSSSLLQSGLTSRSVMEVLISLEKVLSLVVMVECGGCNSAVVGGRCSYVGCNVDQKFEFTCKATFEVISVDTFANLISINEEDIKVILNCSEADWEKVKEGAKVSGKSSQKSCQHLGRLAAAGVARAGSCCVRARRFAGQDWLSVKLFCLKAWRLPSRQINCLYEQLLDC